MTKLLLSKSSQKFIKKITDKILTELKKITLLVAERQEI